jgi:hypothetical protein
MECTQCRRNTGVSKKTSVFISRIKRFRDYFLDCLTLKMKELDPVEISVTTYQGLHNIWFLINTAVETSHLALLCFLL